MQVVLDSRTFPVADRFEEFADEIDAMLLRPTRVEKAVKAEGAQYVMELGPGTLQGSDMTGRKLVLSNRNRSRFHDSAPERLSVGAVLRGNCPTVSGGRVETDNSRLRLVDLSSEYVVDYEGACRVASFEVDCAVLGVGMDAIRHAVATAARSPLDGLIRRHLVDVVANASFLPAEAVPAVGVATVQLIRGLVLSNSSRETDRREAAAESLVQRIQDYATRHLGDPALTPSSLAAAHNISVRYLYQLMAHLDETPAEWIIARRIAAAREDLAYGRGTISNVAQRWGFKDQSHFTRRFKAAYGLTPHQYRQMADASISAGDAATPLWREAATGRLPKAPS
jgi:AraC-like DNA-binding protein